MKRLLIITIPALLFVCSCNTYQWERKTFYNEDPSKNHNDYPRSSKRTAVKSIPEKETPNLEVVEQKAKVKTQKIEKTKKASKMSARERRKRRKGLSEAEIREEFYRKE